MVGNKGPGKGQFGGIILANDFLGSFKKALRQKSVILERLGGR